MQNEVNTIKQALRIKKFVGTSENAVRIQIAVALIVYLLLRMAQSRQALITSPLEFARLVRANLWHPRSLAHLAHPKPPPPGRKKPTNQLTLALT
jgi:IS4 transposase